MRGSGGGRSLCADCKLCGLATARFSDPAVALIGVAVAAPEVESYMGLPNGCFFHVQCEPQLDRVHEEFFGLGDPRMLMENEPLGVIGAPLVGEEVCNKDVGKVGS